MPRLMANLANINGGMCQFVNKLNYFGILRKKKPLFPAHKMKNGRLFSPCDSSSLFSFFLLVADFRRKLYSTFYKNAATSANFSVVAVIKDGLRPVLGFC